MRAEDYLYNAKKMNSAANSKVDTVNDIARQYISAAKSNGVKKSDSGISTASDNKKTKAKTEQPVEIRALGAGDYGASKETRVDKVLKGASQSTNASLINTAGALSGGTGELTMGESFQAAAKGKDYAKEVEKKKERQNARVQQKLYNKADELQGKADENISSAKEGLGEVGQTLVDVGVAGTQMLGDAVLNLASPGAGLIGMGLRSFGSGAQEQRQKGGTETDMLLGGLKSAAIEVFTERLGGFYGKSKLNSVIDDAIKSIGKSGAVPALLTLVKNGVEESVEEILSDIFNPLADRVLDLDNKRGSGEKMGVFSEESVENMIHDGLVGGILGMVGAGGQVVGNTIAKSNANARTAQNEPQAVAGAEQQTTQDVVQNPVTQPQEKLNSMPQVEQTNPLVQAVQNTEAQSNPETHIDNRNMADVGNRSVHAFQYEHPELHDYFVDAAKALRADVEFAIESQVTAKGKGATVYKSESVDRLMSQGISRAQILKALDDIEQNHGAEDYAVAKRVELVLDDMLSRGYIPADNTRMAGGNLDRVAPNDAYLEAKGKIEGSAQTDALSYKVERAIQSTIEAAQFDGVELTREQALAEVQNFPEANGLTQEEITQYIDDGLGAANINFTENMDMATSQYRTNSMERNYDPELLDDYGFEVESGNFDHKIKHNADTMTAAQTMFDYYMEGGGIDAVKEAIFDDNLSGAERGTLAEIAQKYLAEQERNALYDNEITSEEYEKLVSDRLEIAKEKSSLLTEAGQTLQAQTMWNRSDDPNTIFGEASDALAETGLDVAEQKARLKQLDGWLTRLEDINPKSKEATAEMKTLIKEIADKRGVTRRVFANKKKAPIANTIIDWALDRLDYNQLRQLTLNSAQQSVFDVTLEADVGQKLKAVQVIFMLSRPRTLNTNITGNGAFSAVDTVSMNGAALADMLMSQVTGTRSVAADKGLFTKKAWRGMGDAAVKSIAEIMLDANMGAENRYQMTASRTFKADGGAFERLFSVLERENALRMVTTDEVAKGSTRERTIDGLQGLIDEGKIKGASENYAQEQADYLAKERTFQQDSGVADVISQLHDALNAWIGVGDSGRTFGKKNHVVHSAGIGDIVAPFTKVAGNLVSTAYNYSTVKAVTGFADMCEVMYDAKKNGTVDPAKQAKAVKEFARGVNGTAFTLICFAIAKAGLLKRADDEDDPDVAALNAAEGMTGTQLNIDAIDRLRKYGDSSWQVDDRLLDISRLEPLNTLMAVGTVAANWNEDSTMDNIFSVLDTFGESAEELPVLQFKANVDEDVKYGDKRSEAIAKEGINTVISSVIPNIVSGMASGNDRYYRDIYSGDTFAQNVIDNVKSRILGLRQTLPIKQTPMGENKAYSGSPLDIFLNTMVNPIGVNTYGQGDLSKEMQRVREATGAVNFYPDKSAPNKVTVDSKNYELSYDEKQKYMEVAGKYYQRVGAQIISSSEYKRMSDDEKAEVLNALRSESAKVAKSEVMSGKGVGEKEKGMTGAEITDKIAYTKASGDGGDSYKSRITALNNGYSEQKMLDRMVNDDGEPSKARKAYEDMNKGRSEKNKIPLATYLDAYNYKENEAKADKDAKGKSISGSAKKKVKAYINSFDISAADKQAIFDALY